MLQNRSRVAGAITISLLLCALVTGSVLAVRQRTPIVRVQEHQGETVLRSEDIGHDGHTIITLEPGQLLDPREIVTVAEGCNWWGYFFTPGERSTQEIARMREVASGQRSPTTIFDDHRFFFGGPQASAIQIQGTQSLQLRATDRVQFYLQVDTNQPECSTVYISNHEGETADESGRRFNRIAEQHNVRGSRIVRREEPIPDEPREESLPDQPREEPVPDQPLIDTDGDSIPDSTDNCPEASNVNQENTGGKDKGDACEDRDEDGHMDAIDNCVDTTNADQVDTDGDGMGDMCDIDDDGDSVNDDNDTCVIVPNTDQSDQDGDDEGDVCDNDDDNDNAPDSRDNCTLIANTDQSNLNQDSEGDVCDNDRDGDGRENESDNCPSVMNADQSDSDQDRLGDVCDNDRDGDGEENGEDNCPALINADQNDVDQDGIGDLCDDDRDGDMILNQDDNCPQHANTDQANHDSDQNGGDVCDTDDDNDGIPDPLTPSLLVSIGEIIGTSDPVDNCQFTANQDQADLDGDGQGDVCDGDIDGDRTQDEQDNCGRIPNEDQLDTDHDSIGNMCDEDLDGDSILNNDDNCPSLPNTVQEDQNHNGIGDLCDDDIDGDGILNTSDNCPRLTNLDQLNTDRDNQGNACDTDDDNDGIADDVPDICPLIANTDSDQDGTLDCAGDLCPNDPLKIEPGACGCGTPDTDTDQNTIPDCKESQETPQNASPFTMTPVILREGELSEAPLTTRIQGALVSFGAALKGSLFTGDITTSDVSTDTITPPPDTRVLSDGIQLSVMANERCRYERRNDGATHFFDTVLPPPVAPRMGDIFFEYAHTITLSSTISYSTLQSEIRGDPCIGGVTSEDSSEVITVADTMITPLQAADYLGDTGNRFRRAQSFFRQNVSPLPSNRIRVAVIDSGYDFQNEDTTSQYSPILIGSNRAYPRVATENPDVPQDTMGHGTQVATIMMANSQNRLGNDGIAAQNIDLLPVKIAASEEDMKNVTSNDIVEAIRYSVNAGAKIINMSLSGNSDVCDPKVGYAIYKALEKDVFFVFSAGNGVKVDGNGVRIPGEILSPKDDRPAVFQPNAFPACWGRYFKGALTVASLETGTNHLADHSNYGEAVEIAAPGTKIETYNLGNMRIVGNGTSLAAPQVTAAAALIQTYFKQRNWKIYPWLLEDIILQGSRIEPGLTGQVNGSRVLDFEKLKTVLQSYEGMSDAERQRSIPSENHRSGDGWKPDEDIQYIDRLKIGVGKQEIAPGASQQLTLLALKTDGTWEDVTTKAYWTSSSRERAPVGFRSGIVTIDASAQPAESFSIIAHYKNFSASTTITVEELLPEGFTLRSLSLSAVSNPVLSATGANITQLQWGETNHQVTVTAHYEKPNPENPNQPEKRERPVTADSVITTNLSEELIIIPKLDGVLSTMETYGGKQYEITAEYQGQRAIIPVIISRRNYGICLNRAQNSGSCILSPLGPRIYQGQVATVQSILKLQDEVDERPFRAHWSSLTPSLTVNTQKNRETTIDTRTLPIGFYTLKTDGVFRGTGNDEPLASSITLEVTDQFQRLEVLTKTPVVNRNRRAVFFVRRYNNNNSYIVLDPSEVEWSTRLIEYPSLTERYRRPVSLPIDSQGIVYPTSQNMWGSLDGLRNEVSSEFEITAKYKGKSATARIKLVPLQIATGIHDEVSLAYIKIGQNVDFAGGDRCLYNPPVIPELQSALVPWSEYDRATFVGYAYYTDGKVCKITNGSWSVTIPFRTSPTYGSVNLPLNQRPGISGVLSVLYEGEQASINISTPYYPFQAQSLSVYHYFTNGNNSTPIPFVDNRYEIGVQNDAHDQYIFRSTNPYRVQIVSTISVFDPITQQVVRVFPGGRINQNWTTNNTTIRPSLLPLNNYYTILPLANGTLLDTQTLFNNQEFSLRYTGTYIGEQNDRSIVREDTFHVNDLHVIHPPIIDFAMNTGICGSAMSMSMTHEGYCNMSFYKVYEDGTKKEFTTDDLSRLDMTATDDQGRTVDIGLSAGQILTYGETNIPRTVTITATHRNLQKTKEQTIRFDGVKDFTLGQSSQRIPPNGEIEPKKDDPLCSYEGSRNPNMFAGGFGTAKFPYLICTREQLINVIPLIQKALLSSMNTLKNLPPDLYPALCATMRSDDLQYQFICGREHIRLMATIDFSDIPNSNPIKIPLSVDGNGYEIQNFTSFDSETGAGSVFRASYKHIIKNLVLRNPNIRATNAGGIFGFMENGTLSLDNIHVIGGQIWGGRGSGVGGLVGYTRNVRLDIDRSSVRSTVVNFESSYAGGFIGQSDSVIIKNSFSTARLQPVGIQGMQSNIGGLVGCVGYCGYISSQVPSFTSNPFESSRFDISGIQSSIQNSYYRGTITSGNNPNGVGNVGGLIGYNAGAQIIHSFADADIAVTGSNVGGLVGQNTCGNRYRESCVIADSAFRGTLWGGRDRSGASRVGGIVGVSNGGMILRSAVQAVGTGAIRGIDQVGGFIGAALTPYHRLVDNCSNIEVTSSLGKHGGFIGEMAPSKTFTFTNGNTFTPEFIASGNRWNVSRVEEGIRAVGKRGDLRNIDIPDVNAEANLECPWNFTLPEPTDSLDYIHRASPIVSLEDRILPDTPLLTVSLSGSGSMKKNTPFTLKTTLQNNGVASTISSSLREIWRKANSVVPMQYFTSLTTQYPQTYYYDVPGGIRSIPAIASSASSIVNNRFTEIPSPMTAGEVQYYGMLVHHLTPTLERWVLPIQSAYRYIAEAVQNPPPQADVSLQTNVATTSTRGAPLTYTFTLKNDGPEASAEVKLDVRLSTHVLSRLEDIVAVRLDDGTSPECQIVHTTYDDRTRPAFRCTVPTLASGETKTLTAVVTIAPETHGCGSRVITLTEAVTTPLSDPILPNNFGPSTMTEMTCAQ